MSFSPKKHISCDHAFFHRKSAGRHSVAFERMTTPKTDWKAS